MDLELETFGPLAELDFQERFPDALPLNAEDSGAAKAEAARLWQALDARSPVGPVPDSYIVMDNAGGRMDVLYARGRFATRRRG
jgi:hypothetical protein